MRGGLPSLNLLRVFEAAGRLTSFKRAAEELHVTPSAVSHQIKALERELGITLFRRGNRSLELTDAGGAYLAVVARAFARLREGTERVMQAHGPGTLRLSIMTSLARGVVLPRLNGFRERAPGVRLSIESTDAVADVLHDDVDAAVRYGRGDWPGVHAERILDLEIAPMCAPQFADRHALADVSQLARVPVIEMSFFPTGWAHWLRAAGLESLALEGAVWLDSYDACIQAAEQGLGVALGLLPLEQPLIDDGRLTLPFALRVANPAGVYLVCRPADAGRDDIHAFRDWLVAQFR